MVDIAPWHRERILGYQSARSGPYGRRAPNRLETSEGNVYATGPGGILITSPAGNHLRTITPPQVPAGFAWGDADGKTLYMTARTGLDRIRLKISAV